jgi:hypothetical protein
VEAAESPVAVAAESPVAVAAAAVAPSLVDVVAAAASLVAHR